MNCLHDVTYGCTLVTYDASQRCRESGASQSCTRFAAAIRLPAGCCRQDGSRLLYLPPPGISISSTSRAVETGCPHHRRQDCLHCEAFGEIGGTPTFICQHQRVVAERHCEPGVGGVPSAEDQAWVNDHQVGATKFNWNIGLIVCYRRSWNRLMSCWCRISDGRSKRQLIRRR